MLKAGQKLYIGEIGGVKYYRVGVTGDGNCMFHAWLRAMGKHHSTAAEAKLLRAEVIQLLLYDSNFQKSLLCGVDNADVYLISLAADLGLTNHINKKVDPTASAAHLLAYELHRHTTTAPADVLIALADRCNVDLYLISSDGSQLQPQYHRTTTGKRYAVILYNVANFHYEYIVAETNSYTTTTSSGCSTRSNGDNITPHTSNSPLVRALHVLLTKSRLADNK